jgi:hypothetical protein
LIYAHLCVDNTTKELIQALAEMNCNPEKVAAYLARDKGIQLSSHQISLLMHPNHQQRQSLESDELHEFMDQIHGRSFLQESEEDNQIFRTGIATFTQEELTNLEQYGDVVAIDPTFVPLNLNWSVIPLTVIGRSREIHCGGLILCARTSAQTFHWILQLLVHSLPCANILRTIISDDDTALDSAFDRTDDPLILSKDRVICFWHKLQKFVMLANRSGCSEKIKIFQRMGMTRDEMECRRSLDELKIDASPAIKQFLATSVEPKLPWITKSANRAWTLGYITSSVSESMNSGLKANISGRNQTLLEIRKLLIEREQNMEINRKYLKGRQRTPSRKELVRSLIKDLSVSSEIAILIAHSIEKAERLEASKIENEGDAPFWKFRELKPDDVREPCVFQVDNLGSTCTCHKLDTSGLPCSHICAVLRETNSMGKLSSLIHHRWIVNESRRPSEDIEHLESDQPFEIDLIPKDLRSTGLTTQQRYRALLSEATSICVHACRRQDTYDSFRRTLSEFAGTILRPVGDGTAPIVELAGTRCGRPGKHRKRNAIGNTPCPICYKHHEVTRCPHRDDVRKLRNPNEENDHGVRKCKICGLRGHHVRTCTALKRYHKKLPTEPQPESGNPEEIDDDVESDSDVISTETIDEEATRYRRAEPREPVVLRRSKRPKTANDRISSDVTPTTEKKDPRKK